MTDCRSLALALAAAALISTSAPAANLDRAILDKAADLIAALKDAKVKSVGVLPFRVKRGAREFSFENSPLSATLPPRLENALVLRNPGGEDEILVLRGASRGSAWANKEDALKKLFGREIEPAWGDKKAKADAFLTGTVVNDGDRKTTKVEVELVTPGSFKEGKLVAKKLVSFDVKTDRALLRDLGYNIAAFKSRALKTGLKKDDLDGEILERIPQEEKGSQKEPAPKEEGSHSPDDIGGIKFEIEYDGVKQEIKAAPDGGEGAKMTAYELPAPKPGTKVVLFLTRIGEGKEKLGAVLKVNGISTFAQQTDEPLGCQKWIFSPEKKGKRLKFAGWYNVNDKKEFTVREFKVLADDEAADRELEVGARAGWIDLDVFTSREKEDEGVDDLTISTRGMLKARPKTLEEARVALAKENRIDLPPARKRGPGGMMFPDVREKPAGKVTRSHLPNPVRLGGISIRYAAPTGG